MACGARLMQERLRQAGLHYSATVGAFERRNTAGERMQLTKCSLITPHNDSGETGYASLAVTFAKAMLAFLGCTLLLSGFHTYAELFVYIL
eukprot:scaffold51358_cov34-Prasinocladus_malaysianus.AAC.5